MIKDALGERVSDVRASQRLTSSASCLVAAGDGRDRALERLLAQQNQGATDKADSRDQPAASAGRGDLRRARTRQRICRSCCWSRRKSSMAELPEDPAAFASRAQSARAAGGDAGADG